jgi:hypothetical protein
LPPGWRFEDGTIVDAGYDGGAWVGSTTARVGVTVRIPGVGFPLLRTEAEIVGDVARFVQTAGGRTGAPLPRRIDRPPFVRVTAPTAWTTLALSIDADGSSSFELVGAIAVSPPLDLRRRRSLGRKERAHRLRGVDPGP